MASMEVGGIQYVQDGPRRVCFVTVGATAGFRPLLDEVLSPVFRARLSSRGFTDLVIQCGPDHHLLEQEEIRKVSPSPNLEGFAYTDDIDQWLRQCRAGKDDKGERIDGLIICHAGTGSIMAALNHKARLIAVPNPSLMDNHQEELAKEMASQGHLIWGKLGSLLDALDTAFQDLRPVAWPPSHYVDRTQYPGGLFDVIDNLIDPTTQY